MATSRFLTLGDIVAAIPRVDDPDALEQARTDRALQSALDMCRPANWHGTSMGEPLLIIARAEGIPLAWVPRASTIVELANASDAGARLQVLKGRRQEILADCDAALQECVDPWIAGDVALATRALEALQAGHHEASMALAVSLGEPLAAWASTPRVRMFDSRQAQADWEAKRAKSKYKWADIEVAAAGGTNISPYQFKYQVLIAPIPRFFTAWRPEWGTPMPEGLSRHVVAHQSTLEHFTETNALLAMMLIASILRDQQEWSADVRATDHEDD